MVNKQPEALRLAAHAEANANFGDMKLIAAELRRLHEVNQELLEALKGLHDEDMAYITANRFDEAANNPGLVKARAAIAKATGEQT